MRLSGKAKYFAWASCGVVLLGAIAGIVFGGLNLGVDFTGGSLLTVDLGAAYDPADVGAALQAAGIDPAAAQIVRAEDTQAVIRVPGLPEGMDGALLRDTLTAELAGKYPDISGGGVETVGGVTTGETVRGAFFSVLAAIGLMLVYIWRRFGPAFGVAAAAALLHDVLVMTAVVCIARVPVNSPYIAACLVIVGYSAGNTVVVFDRIRENNKKYNANRKKSAKVMPCEAVMELSVRETLPRTVNTTLTALILAAAAAVFGVKSVRDFALPIIAGLIAGACSSLLFAGPLWVRLAQMNETPRGDEQPQIKAKNKT